MTTAFVRVFICTRQRNGPGRRAKSRSVKTLTPGCRRISSKTIPFGFKYAHTGIEVRCKLQMCRRQAVAVHASVPNQPQRLTLQEDSHYVIISMRDFLSMSVCIQKFPTKESMVKTMIAHISREWRLEGVKRRRNNPTLNFVNKSATKQSG